MEALFIHDIHFYKNTNLDIRRISESLVDYYKKKDFEVQHILDQAAAMVEIKKTGVLRAMAGWGKVLQIRMQQEEAGLLVQVKREDKLSKFVALDLSLVVLGPIAMAPALVGTLDERHLIHTILEEVDRLVREQDPNIEIEHNNPNE